MNYILVATWDDLKLSSATIDQNYFKKAHILPLYPPEIDTNHQDFLAGTQQLNREKSDGIGQIEKASILPIDME